VSEHINVVCVDGAKHGQSRANEDEILSELNSVLRLTGLPLTATQDTVTDLFPGTLCHCLSLCHN